MRGQIFIIFALLALLSACASTEGALSKEGPNKGVFNPQSVYPPDPWVKGYSNPDDCLGGEKLAAIDITLPDYPRRAFKSGRQGWVIVRLDVAADGNTTNVAVERAVPDFAFPSNARSAVKRWRFEPPKDGALQNCRILLRYRFGTVSLGG